jgi:hypothetical protein
MDELKLSLSRHVVSWLSRVSGLNQSLTGYG